MDTLNNPPGRSRLTDVRVSAIVSFLAGAHAAWCFEYGEVGWLPGPGARALGQADLTWLVGSVVAGDCYVVLAGPQRSPSAPRPARPAPDRAPDRAPDKVGA